VWALLMHGRADVYPEDIQELARYVLPHRVWLGPHAASHGVTVDMVIDDIVDSVPVP
jgi:MoxR-like ATPase